ncbi:LacI family DNA-binding transcriptional regulator [Macrococcus capreoli]
MVSSKDVAKKAGVSQSTVSRVINNPSTVRKDKREKVERVMKELNYRPNSVARSLISNKTNQISLISGTLNNPFFIESTKTIINYASAHGYNVNVFFEEDIQRDNFYSNVFSQKTDGIILSSMYYDSEYLSELEKLDIPYIMYNRRHRLGGNFVELDNFQAGQIATKYLIDKGHKDILWLGGELKKSTFLGRYNGFINVIESQKISLDEHRIINTSQKPKDIEKALLNVINSQALPTAILAATDMIALTVLNVLKRENIKVPEDVAVIGIDNTEMVQHALINLTTVGIHENENLALEAIVQLIDAIKANKSVNYRKTFKCKLFERGTA